MYPPCRTFPNYANEKGAIQLGICAVETIAHTCGESGSDESSAAPTKFVNKPPASKAIIMQMIVPLQVCSNSGRRKREGKKAAATKES